MKAGPRKTMERALSIWHRFTFSRYLVASIIALAFDMASFSTLITLGQSPTLASAMGYCVGIIIHWLVSAEIVFPGKTREGAALAWQRVLFAGSAMLGLAITVATVTVLARVGVHPVPAKGVAIVISFFAVYAARKWGVFR